MGEVMQSSYDVVIVGGGVAGSGLATMLARGGKSVLVLEKTAVYQDLVRGEWLAPWGVVEAKRTGLYDVLAAENGHHLTYHVQCGDGIDPAEADAQKLNMGAFLPDVPGPLAIGHPQACQALTDAAAASGAAVVRGVADARVEPGAAPTVAYMVDGVERSVSCRIVVGADGRGSAVRRQAGVKLTQDPTHHMFSGLLVEDAHGWPEDVQCIGTEGDVEIFVFPQGRGKARLYLGFGTDQKTRFSGPDGPRKFLDAFRLKTVPHVEAIAGATIAGPCHSVPNQGAKTDRVTAPGVVLVGDAAGYSDPISGQGLAIAMRDVRSVGEAMLASEDWSEALFAPYGEERRERMRRLAFTTRLSSQLQAEFGPAAAARRLRYRARTAEDPSLGLASAAALIGPEMLPPQAFSDEEWARLQAV